MKVNIVNLRLSGSNDKTYAYIYDPALMSKLEYVKPGDRAVVPSKLKEDGSISLAIGTVMEVHRDVEPDPAIKYKHVVQFLDPMRIYAATVQLQEEAIAETKASGVKEPLSE